MLLVQFLVLAFTAALWWIARRDLTSRAAPPLSAPAEAAELEPLLATLESLVTDLARRLAVVERQLSAPAVRQSQEPGARLAAPSSPTAERVASRDLPRSSEGEASEPLDARYAPVYALLAQGVTDPQEIARQTGFSQGEVSLILSLRARRAL